MNLNDFRNNGDIIYKILNFFDMLFRFSLLVAVVFIPISFFAPNDFIFGEMLGIGIFGLALVILFLYFIRSFFSDEEWKDMNDYLKKLIDEEKKKKKEEKRKNK